MASCDSFSICRHTLPFPLLRVNLFEGYPALVLGVCYLLLLSHFMDRR